MIARIERLATVAEPPPSSCISATEVGLTVPLSMAILDIQLTRRETSRGGLAVNVPEC